MKPTYVAALSALGMLLSSVTVYSITAPPGAVTSGAVPEATTGPEVAGDAPAQARGNITRGSDLMVEGRVGHPRLVRGGNGETYVMLEVRGADHPGASRPAAANLALVIDRSGSMKGNRIRNALTAATTAVDRLSDGDVVSVIAFDTRTEIVVPPTPIHPHTREGINARIRSIALGGDTCISCGLDAAMAQLAETSGKVSRVLLLSDGDANHGVRDVAGFRGLAQRAQARGVSVTTIGVDVDYNERIMTALAQDSNGRHYFVANAEALPRIFELEAESLGRTLASEAEATIDLAPGVELDRVYDRAFRRNGSQVIVPLGSFAGAEVKTVLLKVRAPSGADGVVPVAEVDVAYHDAAGGSASHVHGQLSTEIVADPAQASALDAQVSGRLERSETAAVLQDANTLFERGQLDEAKKRLQAREDALRTVAAEAKRAAPAKVARQVDADFERQLAAVGDANQVFQQPEFATPPPSPHAAPPAAPRAVTADSRAGKSARKQNASRALDMGF